MIEAIASGDNLSKGGGDFTRRAERMWVSKGGDFTHEPLLLSNISCKIFTSENPRCPFLGYESGVLRCKTLGPARQIFPPLRWYFKPFYKPSKTSRAHRSCLMDW